MFLFCDNQMIWPSMHQHKRNPTAISLVMSRVSRVGNSFIYNTWALPWGLGLESGTKTIPAKIICIKRKKLTPVKCEFSTLVMSSTLQCQIFLEATALPRLLLFHDFFLNIFAFSLVWSEVKCSSWAEWVSSTDTTCSVALQHTDRDTEQKLNGGVWPRV